MPVYRYTTPGTRLTWSNVSEWIEAAHRINRRNASRHRNRALANHGAAMPRELIDRERDIDAIEAALSLLKYGHPSLSRPQRGSRGNHPTTPIIVDLMNRLAVLKRDAEMPAGNNWVAMHGGSDADTP